MGATVNFRKRIHHVEEWISLARFNMLFETAAASDHLIEHLIERVGVHFAAAGWRAKHGAKANAMESELNEFIERFVQLKVVRRYSYSRRDLHSALHLQKRCYALNDFLVTS